MFPNDRLIKNLVQINQISSITFGMALKWWIRFTKLVLISVLRNSIPQLKKAWFRLLELTIFVKLLPLELSAKEFRMEFKSNWLWTNKLIHFRLIFNYFDIAPKMKHWPEIGYTFLLINPLRASPTKWLNTLKKFVGQTHSKKSTKILKTRTSKKKTF